jgi:hypothetical protein
MIDDTEKHAFPADFYKAHEAGFDRQHRRVNLLMGQISGIA